MKVMVIKIGNKYHAVADYGLTLTVERTEALAKACGDARYDVFKPQQD